LKRETFHGPPGLHSDALPDRFGNRNAAAIQKNLRLNIISTY
jgi:hypothetical protein